MQSFRVYQGRVQYRLIIDDDREIAGWADWKTKTVTPDDMEPCRECQHYGQKWDPDCEECNPEF